MNPAVLIPVVVQIAGLLQQIIANWDRDDYKPVMPEELQEALDRLMAMEELPEGQ